MSEYKNDFEVPYPKRAKKEHIESIEEYIDQQVDLKKKEIEVMKGRTMATYKMYRQKINYLVKEINKAGDYAQMYIGGMNEMERDPIWKIVEKDFKKQMNAEGFGTDFKFLCKKDPAAMGGESGYLHYLRLTLQEY